MKIVISAGGAIWNESHPCLKKYGDDVLVMRHGSAAELVARIGEDRNVAVLTDNDPASFEVYDMLAGAFKSRRIHLFACLPFTYESRRRKQEILDRLASLDMVKSLCLVPLDGFLTGSSNGETLGSLQLRIRNDMMALLVQAAEQMEGLEEFCQYRYDLENGSYAPCDFESLGAELQMRLFAKRRRAEEQTEGVTAELRFAGQKSAEAQTTASPDEEPAAGLPSAGTGTMETAAAEASYMINSESPSGESAERTEKDVPESGPEETPEPAAEPSGKFTANAGREHGKEAGVGEERPAAKMRRGLFDFLRRKKA